MCHITVQTNGIVVEKTNSKQKNGIVVEKIGGMSFLESW